MRQANTALVMALVAALVSLSGCSEENDTPDQSGEASQPVTIIAQPVTYRSNNLTVKAIGTARAKRTAVIQPDSGGEVIAVNFAAGDAVEAKSPLLELDARAERLAVEAAAVALQDARQLLQRYERIKVAGAISASQIDAARIATQAAGVAQQQAELALTKRTVLAPFTGYVGLTDIDPGARITPSTVITQLDDRSELFVDFTAPEEVFQQISNSKTVTVRPFAYPDKQVEARILTTDSRIAAGSRSFTVRAVIANSNDQFRPGMSFRIEFDVAGQRYPSVPEAAIVWGGDGAYLWAVRDGKAKRVSLTIVARSNGQVLVKAPLPEGSLIVAEGVQKVREGAPVTAIDTAAEKNPEKPAKLSSDSASSARSPSTTLLSPGANAAALGKPNNDKVSAETVIPARSPLMPKAGAENNNAAVSSPVLRLLPPTAQFRYSGSQ